MIFKEFERKGFVEVFPMPEDKSNKINRFTAAGKKYADTIISELRKVEIFALEEIGIERIRQLNDSMALFVELFSKAGGKNGTEA